MLCLVYPMGEGWRSKNVSMPCLVYSVDEKRGSRSVSMLCLAYRMMRDEEVEV